MPRPSSTVPFETAVALVGGEEVLFAVVTRRNTVATWRRRGVPWSTVGPLLARKLQSLERLALLDAQIKKAVPARRGKGVK